MVLGIGFAISASGPVRTGVLRDLTGSFHTATMILPVTGLLLLLVATTLPDVPRRAEALQPVHSS